MIRDIKSFLEEIGEEELRSRGILRPSVDFAYLLRATSARPLVALMSEKGVNLLVGPLDTTNGEGWYLDVHGNFGNPWSHGEKTGNVFTNPRRLFQWQNATKNPYFKHGVKGFGRD